MKLNLKKLGEHEILIPKSMAICLDFVSVWGSEPNRAQLGHLCAGAIGVAVDHSRCLPMYKPEQGDPVGYGFKILDRLLSAGVTPNQVYEMGSNVLVEMMKVLPSEEQVETTANFS